MRPARLADAPRLAALHETCFPDSPWDEAYWQDAVMLTVVEVAEQGLCQLRVAADEAEVMTICVAPEARGQGLGRMLLRAAAARAHGAGADRLFLEVAVENASARSLYAKLGFKAVGLRKGYYAAGGDALVLARDLPLEEPGAGD